MYQISHGMFLTYHNSLDYKLLHTNHKLKTIEKFESQFPVEKFKRKTKETFIVSCLYVIFTKAPSSFYKMVEELKNLDFDDVIEFKRKIMDYERYIKRDINLIKEKGFVTKNDIINMYIKNEIMFYTVYFYLKFTNQFESLKNSRVHKLIYKKLKFIMLFLSFKKESIEKIRKLINEIL
jgi:hypothetical protein